MPGPEGGPPPDPGTGETPNPDQVPLPDGVPAPIQLTVSVVGLLGNLSFAPNPLQAAIGSTIVWMNNDFLPHDIVLDDGTPVGNLAPGQSSLPILLATETASYHCTIHPSMVGQITTIPIAEPVPGDPSQGPPPDPSVPPAIPDPYGDGDGGDDGYEYDYY
jgi:plastocyanin